MKITDKKIKLNNGLEMPMFGYGTYRITDEKVGIEAITHAINYGYKMIDTAEYYKNDPLIAQAIKIASYPREELFITSKVWPNETDPVSIEKRVDKILSDLNTDHLDLLLVHWPKPDGDETYQVLEKLYQTGKVKAIGVSNYNVEQLKTLISKCQVKPMVNQVELHPNAIRKDVVDFCQANDIAVTSWQTIMEGKVDELPQIKTLAEKYHVDGAAIALRWALQRNIIVIPKSVTPARIESNLDNLNKFELLPEEVETINQASTEKGQRMNSEEFVAA